MNLEHYTNNDNHHDVKFILIHLSITFQFQKVDHLLYSFNYLIFSTFFDEYEFRSSSYSICESVAHESFINNPPEYFLGLMISKENFLAL
jgi:hypothetical protein